MATNRDFRDLFAALSDAGAEFIVVDAHAVMVHTEPRYTKDLDIWIRATPQNAAHAYRALQTFGAPLADLTVDDLATAGAVFQIGIAPNRIDILTEVTAWTSRVRGSEDSNRLTEGYRFRCCRSKICSPTSARSVDLRT